MRSKVASNKTNLNQVMDPQLPLNPMSIAIASRQGTTSGVSVLGVPGSALAVAQGIRKMRQATQLEISIIIHCSIFVDLIFAVSRLWSCDTLCSVEVRPCHGRLANLFSVLRCPDQDCCLKCRPSTPGCTLYRYISRLG